MFAYFGLSCGNGHISHQNKIESTENASDMCNGKQRCTGVVSLGLLGGSLSLL